MTTPYETFRAQCASGAETWLRAAETARTAGNLQLAHLCSDQAIKCGYLAQADPDLERPFNLAAAGAVPGYVWRTDNLSPEVRMVERQILLVFKYPPTERELEWVMANLPEGVDRANRKYGAREFDEVVYTHRAELERLRG